MSRRLHPVKRRELIRRLRRLGWEGPFPGGDHFHMKKDGRPVPIPNVQEIDTGLLRRILNQTETSREEWFAAAG